MSGESEERAARSHNSHDDVPRALQLPLRDLQLVRKLESLPLEHSGERNKESGSTDGISSRRLAFGWRARQRSVCGSQRDGVDAD